MHGMKSDESEDESIVFEMLKLISNYGPLLSKLKSNKFHSCVMAEFDCDTAVYTSGVLVPLFKHCNEMDGRFSHLRLERLATSDLACITLIQWFAQTLKDTPHSQMWDRLRWTSDTHGCWDLMKEFLASEWLASDMDKRLKRAALNVSEVRPACIHLNTLLNVFSIHTHACTAYGLQVMYIPCSAVSEPHYVAASSTILVFQNTHTSAFHVSQAKNTVHICVYGLAALDSTLRVCLNLRAHTNSLHGN